QLEALLCELVSLESKSGSKGEVTFPYQFKDKLMELAYFRENPSHIQFHNADKERNAVTALYKRKEATQTVVLISHFDTVHTKDFSALEQYALHPKKLIKQFKKIINTPPEKTHTDVNTNDYLIRNGKIDIKIEQ